MARARSGARARARRRARGSPPRVARGSLPPQRSHALARRIKVLVSPLGAIYVALGVLCVVVAALLLLNALFPALIGVVAVNGTAKGENGAFPAMVMMFGTTGVLAAFATAFGVLGLAYIADGAGILARKPWARWLGVVLAFPALFACFPVGTLVGVLALVALFMPDVAAEFDGARDDG